MWWLVSYFQKQSTRLWMWNKRLHCMQSKKLSVNFRLNYNKTWDCSGPCNMWITGKQADLCLCYLATCMCCCDFAAERSPELPVDCKTFLICQQVTILCNIPQLAWHWRHGGWHCYCVAIFQATSLPKYDWLLYLAAKVGDFVDWLSKSNRSNCSHRCMIHCATNTKVLALLLSGEDWGTWPPHGMNLTY